MSYIASVSYELLNRRIEKERQPIRHRFAQDMKHALALWRASQPDAGRSRLTYPLPDIIHALNKGERISERQLKGMIDTLSALIGKEPDGPVKQALEQCLHAIPEQGKHLMGYGRVEAIQR